MLNWYCPGPSEIAFAQEIFDKYVVDELKKWSEKKLSKVETLKSLNLVKACMAGAAPLMPWFQAEEVPLVVSDVSVAPFDYVIDREGKGMKW